MRWKVKNPNEGDIRIVRKFAFFPIQADDEIRWLERVTIAQKYYSDYDGSGWNNLYFVKY